MEAKDYVELASKHAQDGRVEEALSLLQEAVERFPDVWQLWAMTGQILLETGQPEKAIDPLERARDLAPEVFLPHFLLGSALGRAFALSEGIAELEIAESMRPNDAEVLRNLGWMRCMNNDVERGRQTLMRALQLEPDNPFIYNDLAASYLYTNDCDVEKAQDYCLRALEIAPSHPAILHTWHYIVESQGREDE